VNGRLVEEATLNSGDEVAIAQVIYRLEDLVVPTTRPPGAGAPATLATQTEKPSSLPELPAAPLESDDDDLIPLDDDLVPNV
jgi:hypothetical protein